MRPQDNPRPGETTTGHGTNAGTERLREQRIARTFVELADTLVAEFDLTDFLHLLVDHCVDLLNVSAAGVVLADQRGGVRMAAASSESAELLTLFAAETQGGPCVECLRTGQPVSSTDLPADAARWPQFAAAAEACGFGAIHAVPMRLRREVIGALSLLNTHASAVEQLPADLGQALADVATIGILQHRGIEHSEQLTEQLQTALNTRVVIEQAKGMLAAHSDTLSPEQAFAKLRGYAHAHRMRLSNLANDVINGTADIEGIINHPGTDHGTDLG